MDKWDESDSSRTRDTHITFHCSIFPSDVIVFIARINAQMLKVTNNFALYSPSLPEIEMGDFGTHIF